MGSRTRETSSLYIVFEEQAADGRFGDGIQLTQSVAFTDYSILVPYNDLVGSILIHHYIPVHEQDTPL